MSETSRRVRVVAMAVVVAAAVGGAAATYQRWSATRAAEAASTDALLRAKAGFEAIENLEVKKLSSRLDALIANRQIVQAFQARDRAALLALAEPMFRSMKAADRITHWYFLEPEPDRRCFLRVHSPALFGDVVQRETFTQAIETHDVGFGKELGKTAFALRVVKPIRVDGRIAGYMELGREIDDFLEQIHTFTGDDFGLLVEKTRVDRAELARVRGEDRWDERPDVVLIDSTMWNERMIDLGVPVATLPASGHWAGTWEDGDRLFAGSAFPVRSAAGKPVAALFVRHELQAGSGSSVLRWLTAAAAAAIAFAVVLGVGLRRRRAA